MNWGQSLSWAHRQFTWLTELHNDLDAALPGRVAFASGVTNAGPRHYSESAAPRTVQALQKKKIDDSLEIAALLAFPFLSLGSWCLIKPDSVEKLCFKKRYRHESPMSRMLISCFGAQAVLMGATLATVQRTREFHVAFSALMFPFFIFNCWGLFGAGEKLFTPWLWLDFLGNCLIFSVTSVQAYKLR